MKYKHNTTLDPWRRYYLIASAVVVTAAYATSWIYLYQWYKYILNPDAISYITIANLYRSGDVGEAINAYWSPLYSWLIAIVTTVTGLNPLLAAKLVAAAAGLATALLVVAMLYREGLAWWQNLIVSGALAPVIAFWSLTVVTPDTLVLALLLLYVFLVTSKVAGGRHAALTGLVAGFAFLAKSVVLPVFLASHVLLHTFGYWRQPARRSAITRSFWVGLIPFLVVAAVWCGALTLKYGHPTIGSTTSYNYALVGPDSKGHPVDTQGLLAIPSEHAVSAWQDPTYIQVKAWSPLENMRYAGKLAIRNLGITLVMLYSFSAVAVVLSIVWLAGRSDVGTTRRRLLRAAVPLTILAGVYTTILVEPRYIWLLFVVLVVWAAVAAAWLASIHGRLAAVVLLGVLALSLLLPVYRAHPIPPSPDAGQTRQVADESRAVISGSMASNSNWAGSLQVAYYLQVQYLGNLGPVSQQAAVSQVENFKPDCMLIWGDSINASGRMYLSSYDKVRYLPQYDVGIYKRKAIIR